MRTVTYIKVLRNNDNCPRNECQTISYNSRLFTHILTLSAQLASSAPIRSCTAHYNKLLNLSYRSPAVAQIKRARSMQREARGGRDLLSAIRAGRFYLGAAPN